MKRKNISSPSKLRRKRQNCPIKYPSLDNLPLNIPGYIAEFLTVKEKFIFNSCSKRIQDEVRNINLDLSSTRFNPNDFQFLHLYKITKFWITLSNNISNFF